MMIRLADYIMRRLVAFGVRHVFMITGGGAMHLNDAVGKQPGLNYICHHHEQACSMAAEGYARSKGETAVVMVTTGPGGLNTLSGLMGQWTDSVPVVYISGQVKYETSLQNCPGIGLRQLGDQEVDIVEVVQPLVKYAASINDPDLIRYELEKAWSIASEGRPGPVWLDIPIDVQGAMVDDKTLKPFLPVPSRLSTHHFSDDILSNVFSLLCSAQRPIFVAGHGIRLSRAVNTFQRLVENISIPVVTTFNGFDLIDSKHPLFIGRIGTIGGRAGNFALQNSDLVFFLGTRNNIRQISYNYSCYARSAKKVVVDIDAAELTKPTLTPDIEIHADVGHFLLRLYQRINDHPITIQKDWLKWCRERKAKYPINVFEYQNDGPGINPYWLVKQLSDQIDNKTTIVTSNGTASVAYFQGATVKEGQRVLWNSGCASMGYGLPASLGAALATGRLTICLEGDGSLMMNLQELQTLAHHQFPVKLFVLNNGGYHSIRQTQQNFFGPRLVGCDPQSGVSFPDMRKIAAAFGLPYFCLQQHHELSERIAEVLNSPGPVFCEVIINPLLAFSPKTASIRRPDGNIVSRPLEDMAPFLDRNEFMENMLIPPLAESLE